MDLIRRETVRELLASINGPCVSVFAPLHPGTADARQDAIRLRKFLSPAEEQLVDRGLGRHAARELLAPLRRLTDGNTPWKYEGHGLAMFLAPGFERTFPLAAHVEEALYVDDRFHLRPLLPLVTEGDRFFVLALSQNNVRLLEGWAGGLVNRGFPGPHEFDGTTNVNHMMRGDKVHEGVESSVDRRAAHVKGPRKSKEDLRHFVREVASHVDERLRGESAPLVLATTELTAQLWREESKYRHTLGAFVQGNADYLPTDELHARAWPLVEPALVKGRQVPASNSRRATAGRECHSISAT
jgi:hypothetical protein